MTRPLPETVTWTSRCDVCGSDATWRSVWQDGPGDETQGAGFRKRFTAQVIACVTCAFTWQAPNTAVKRTDPPPDPTLTTPTITPALTFIQRIAGRWSA